MDLPPLRTVDVSWAIVVVALFLVHLLATALEATAELSIVAEPSKPPSSPKKLCPQPVVAKVIKAAETARAWNLKRDFATALFLNPESKNPAKLSELAEAERSRAIHPHARLLNPFSCTPLNPSNPESLFRPRYTACVLSESTQYIGSRTPKMPKVYCYVCMTIHKLSTSQIVA
jgi:hypothetical protein